MYIKSRNFKTLESEAIVHSCTDIYNNLNEVLLWRYALYDLTTFNIFLALLLI